MTDTTAAGRRALPSEAADAVGPAATAETAQPSRRRFLQVGAAAGGGLLVGFSFDALAADEARDKKPSEAAVGSATGKLTGEAPWLATNAFIRIDRDGTVTLIAHKAEMGQGTLTSIPMLLAEELEVDLAKVRIAQALADNGLYADPLLGGQVTGGSTSIRGAWKPLREAGAATRMLLVQAAAQAWKVDAADCVARDGAVAHAASGRSLHYGQLVDAAAKLPAPKNVALKKPEAFRLIGTPHRRLDSPAKVNGQAQFGIDVRLKGMGIATVAASPVPDGTLASSDDAKALAVKGVRQVLKLDNAVAVVGDHMWAAKQGLAALAPTWKGGPNGGVSTASIVAEMDAASKGAKAAVARNDGDAAGALARAGRKVEAVYQLPFLAHATMEPMNCTVDLRADACDLWVGTQVPALAQGVAAKLTGLPVEKVSVHNQYLGGGFGRRLEVDFIVQAVAFAKQAKGPVKFVWTREEDTQHGMYRPYYLDRIAAALDDKGRPLAWSHRVTGSSVLSRFAPAAVKDGLDRDAVEGARDMPYAIPKLHVDYVRHEPPLPTAFWRGVGPTHNIFVVESFIDELASQAQADPLAYRQALLGKSPRLRAVLDLAADKAGWRTPLAPVAGHRVGRGLSVQFAFGSYMAQVVEVAVDGDGQVKVRRVVCALDCGQIVNPDTVTAQIESGVVFGLTAALWSEITVEQGRVQQANFNTYRMMRINEAPRIEVHMVRSGDDPGGIGEPGTSEVAPALANAIFAATGKRIRRLPVASADLKSA